MSQNRKDRPPEAVAVRTTIVGGRPPGAGQALSNVPRGLEVLLKKAAVDPAFKEQLLARRGDAARDLGLTLSPAEVALLQATPAAQLEAIVARTTVPERHRAAFLGQAAAVMLAALGLAAFESGCGPGLGSRPDGPRPNTQSAQPTPTTEATGDQPAAPADAAPAAAPSQGVRPERPMTKGHDASRPPAAPQEPTP